MTTTRAPQASAPNTLDALWQRSHRAHGERRALGSLHGESAGARWQWVSYGELDHKIRACQHALWGLGVREGDRVALIMENCVEWAVIAYACYGMSAVVVPTYEQQSPELWRHVLEDSGARVAVVAGEHIIDALGDASTRPETLEHVLSLTPTPDHTPLLDQVMTAAEHTSDPPWRTPQPNDIASILYTSGTTGKPRGVMLTHHNLTSNIMGVAGRFELGCEDVGVSFLPWAHSLGQLADLHVMLSRGAAIAISNDTSSSAMWTQLGRVRPTVMVGVPSLFSRVYDEVHEQLQQGPVWKRMLLRESLNVARASRALQDRGRGNAVLEGARQGLDRLGIGRVRERFGGRLRFAISGGASLSEEVARWMSDLGIPVYQGYGLTETSPVIAVNAPHRHRTGSAGLPLPGVDVQVISEDGELLPPGERGEVVSRGPNLMRGYWGDEEATEAAMIHLNDDPQPYLKTGDLGYIDDHGFLFITGRRRAIFKLSTGRFVNPALVEARLNLHPLITQSFVAGLNQEHPVALLVPSRPITTAWADDHGVRGSWVELVANPRVHHVFGDAIAETTRELKPFEVPQRWLLLLEPFSPANGLMTPSGKLRRHAIQSRYQELIAL